jgi:hypothetical protein
VVDFFFADEFAVEVLADFFFGDVSAEAELPTAAGAVLAVEDGSLSQKKRLLRLPSCGRLRAGGVVVGPACVALALAV